MANGHTERDEQRVADVIATELRQAGVEWVAGHPGGEVTVLIDALSRAGIRFILTHHESTAAFMAAAHGELTGRPGVSLATLGPGATNMVTGVANAYLDRAPMVAITGALATDGPHGKSHQALDLHAMYASVSKASLIVKGPDARETTRSATELALSGRKGPVHVAVPSNVAAGQFDAGARAKLPGTRAVAGAQPYPEPPADDLEHASRLLSSAERPAIIAGLGALEPGISRHLRDLAISVGAAVCVTPKAKGVFDETHPQFAGVLEVAGDDLVREFLAVADLLLLVGLDVVELDKPWQFQAPTIHVDAQPHQEGFLPVTLELAGNIATILQKLQPPQRQSGWPLPQLQKHSSALHRHLCPMSPRLQPWQVVETVWDAFGGRAIATSDTGAHKFLCSQLWKAREPKSFFVSNGLSSMGYGIPTAAAVRMAHMPRDDTPVVAFVGDGGISMFLGELGTLSRLGLQLLIVVLVDGSLELIRRSQVERGIVQKGTLFENPDFVAIATAYGASGHRVERIEELETALNQVKRSPRLHLIAAEVNGEDYQL